MTIQQVSFCATKPGKHLVIFGAVHGNEKCGTEAINRMIIDINNSKIPINSGKVTFIPIANPKAYEKDVRFIERNLNRYLYPKDNPVHYEDFLTPILCKILDDADALLDLHSYQSQGGAFGFLGTTNQNELDFSRSLGVNDFVYGWSDAFSASSNNENAYESMGTTEYTRHKGGIAVTIECGNHNNNDNVDIAYEAIKRALAYMNIIDNTECETSSVRHRCIKMHSVYYKEKPGSLIQAWQHYDFVARGTIIANYDDGTDIVAPADGYLVLPKESTDHPIGSEWFYFGIETEFPECGPTSA